MNVRFFVGTKADYLSLPSPRNPLGLYFCADTKELFWADRLLTDGTRIVPTFADLPSFEKAAEGITYYVEETRNGYVLSADRSKWIQVIYAPDNGSVIKAISFAGIEMEEVDGVFTIDRRCAREALGFKVPEGMENEVIVIATEDFVKNEIDKINNQEVSLDGYATEQYVTDAIAAINPVVEEVKTKLEEEVLPIVPTVQETILPTVQKVEKEILPTVQELAEKAATQEWVNEQGFLTEHQSLEGLATEEFVEAKIAEAELADQDVDLSAYYTKSEVDALIPEVPAKVSELENDAGYLTEHQDLSEYAKKVDVPSIDGLASEAFVRDAVDAIEIPATDLSSYSTTIEMTDAIATAVGVKADEVPFVDAKPVANAIGSFKVGDSVNGLTVAQILAKLLGLNDEPGENPDEPHDITVEIVKQNSIPVMQGSVNTSDGSTKVEDANSIFTHLEIAEEDRTKAPVAAEPGTSALYEIKTDSGEVIEHGYQIYTIASGRGTYWRVAIPVGLVIKEVQMYDAGQLMWVEYTPEFTDTGERLESNGYYYTVYQSSDRANEEILRFILE